MTTLSDKIAAVEKMLAEATPGPCKWETSERLYAKTDNSYVILQDQDACDSLTEGDSALIAAAPTLIREMLEVVKAARDTVGEFEDWNEDWAYIEPLFKALEKFAGNEGGGE